MREFFHCCLSCVFSQATIDDSVDAITSCVEFYGAKYDPDTLKVVESVKKDCAVVSLLFLIDLLLINNYVAVAAWCA